MPPQEKKRLHVLQVSGVMNHGGAEVMLMDILRHLPDDVRFDFLIQTSGAGGKPPVGAFDEEIRQRGCRIFYICPQWNGLGLGYIRQFKKLLREEIGIPDVVHSHLNRKGGMVALAARLAGVKKIIVHTHGSKLYSFWDLRPRAVEAKILRFLVNHCATDFWACSEPEAKILFSPSICEGHRYEVINNAMNMERFMGIDPARVDALRQEFGISGRELVLGYAATFVRGKNYIFVPELLDALRRRGADTRFLFMGRLQDKEYYEEFRREVSRLDLEKSVTYLGDRDDVPECLALLNVFIGPSLKEGFGMVITESQGAGIPCVVSPGYSHAVDLGLDLVCFMEDYDPEKWADAILRMRDKRCTDKEKIRQAVIRSGFDSAENTRRIVELYRS